jgi:very-short-patch-repair endonuclease
LEEACPISENNFRSLLAALRHFTLEKRHELSLSWPDTLPSSQRLAHLVECEKRAIEEETRLTRGANEHLADLLSKSHVTVVEAIHNALSTFLDMRRRLSATHHLWIHDALRDVLSGNPALWQELYRVTRDAIDSIEALVPVADDNSIDLPDEANIKRLREDVLVLKEHMHNGGKLGWGPFRQKLVKERICVLKTVRVNGQAPANLEYLSVLADALLVRIETEKAWGFWIGRCEKSQGPYGLQLPALKGLCDSVDGALSVGGLIEKCRESLQQCPHIGEPLWPDEVQIEQLVASCRLALARHGKRLAVEEIRNIEAPLASITAQNNAHTIVRELLLAIRNRDVEGFAQCWNTMRELEKDRQRVQKVDEYVSQLRRLVPKLTAELDRTCADPCWEERAQHIHSAWHWAQARFWVEEYIRKDDALSLSNRANQIEDKINEVIVKLAALHAWSFCISRLTKHHCRHMEAWRKHVGSLSKTGRGKRDFRNRQAAQRSLNECKDAVPAWVMPLHRVWDTVDPAPGMFDIVIVDEASQCGYEALPLLYLCKRILIVGDDKQISPGGEFQDTTPINRYLDVYLYDFSFREFFDVNVSLFALGKLLYGTRKIALREHFRCMPEIIRFSNDLCYSDTPLIPLRQYGPDRLRPLEHVFVSGGYREGSGDRVVNQPEAEAVVAKIVELCRDARYSKKTMGVVVLQGEAQGGLIEGQLLERLGAEEMDRRRLVCGNPYSFQGDERDIMFLSMVAAPNERIGPLTKAADERRFNVAASRARDQMWLFHSVTCDDLSTTCLRRRLLEFFQNTKPQQVAGIDRDELERRASQDNRRVVKPPKPFESWFEVDVALELVRKGFNVRPQYEVAGKRIDLVIEGGQARLAVECDGDEWHGAEQYEADMQRQRQLERCGWEFFRVRESAFYSNKDEALKDLWRLLEERGIFPRSPFAEENPDDDEEEEVFEESYSDETEDNGENLDCDMPPRDDSSESSGESGRRVQEVTASEIQDAICQVLSDCPNQSCTEKSLAARVLRELGVLTRGNPRVEFEKRVLRCVTSLERRSVVEKYRAKNRRVRLLNP